MKFENQSNQTLDRVLEVLWGISGLFRDFWGLGICQSKVLFVECATAQTTSIGALTSRW
jgi:hypothetical protein